MYYLGYSFCRMFFFKSCQTHLHKLRVAFIILLFKQRRKLEPTKKGSLWSVPRVACVSARQAEVITALP